MNGGKALAARWSQNAHTIDDRIGAFDGAGDRDRVTQIGLHGDDLANTAHGLQMTGEIGAP